MARQARDDEIFLKCPKCNSLFSTTRSILERDKYSKVSLTRFILGGKVAPAAYTPKCTRCSTKLEKISLEQFQSEINAASTSEPGKGSG